VKRVRKLIKRNRMQMRLGMIDDYEEDKIIACLRHDMPTVWVGL
jgi:hypothetical protein